MSVRPVAFNPDGSIDVVHDDAPGGAHSGTVAAVALGLAAFSQLGAQSHNSFALPCPVAGCGSSSLHSIGGGAAPAAVQELFVRVIRRLGCPCGQVAAGASPSIAQAHVKLQAERIDGIGRWAIQGQLT